jgi:hypothetical protein
MPPRLLSAVPVLLTPDTAATAAFFSRLGFSIRYRSEGLVILQRDAVTLNFTACADPSRIAWSSCRIEVDAVDALHGEFAPHGVIHPRGPLRDTEHGTREFGIIDQHGVGCTFFQRR